MIGPSKSDIDDDPVTHGDWPSGPLDVIAENRRLRQEIRNLKEILHHEHQL